MGYAITAKGQVTLPKSVRERLGVKPGETVDFRVNGQGEVVVERTVARSFKASARSLFGFFGPGPTTDEVLADTRGDE